VAVKPGIVFSSLMMTSPLGVRKKSTRARPAQPKALNAFMALALISSAAAFEIGAGSSIDVAPSKYFASKS
jgi:hypothetical protein